MNKRYVLILCVFIKITILVSAGELDSYLGVDITDNNAFAEKIGAGPVLSGLVQENLGGNVYPAVSVFSRDYDYLIFLKMKDDKGAFIVYDTEYIELDSYYGIELVRNKLFIHKPTPESVRLWYLYDYRDLRDITDYIVEEPDPLSLGIDPSGLYNECSGM